MVSATTYRHILLFTFTIAGSSASSQIPSNTIADSADTLPVELKTTGHRPGSGFLLLEKDQGSLAVSLYSNARYLNQMSVRDSNTDAFGRKRRIAGRNDIQFQNVMVYFKGWALDPRFRYLLYVWTSNANIGQGAQVVVGGNLQYRINSYFDVGLGIGGLPSTRSLLGQWPAWLRMNNRPMAEEFFRGSFTTGVWLQGEITKNLYYKTMLGNNLSQLGIDAGQLDQGFDTWATSLWWSSTGYGQLRSFGDFEKQDKLASTIGAAFTRSDETRQSQPGTEAPENTQIRLSDGTGLFSLNAFGTGGAITEARYQMASMNAGLKYKGFSLDGEYFLRWLDDFDGVGHIPVSSLFDNGYTVQASAMIINKTLQVYGIGSFVNGEYGDPWELNGGVNWYPFKSRVFRLNGEVIYTEKSPVGYLSYCTVVGMSGTVFMINLEFFY